MPPTLQILRQYALHLLFSPPAPSPGMSTESAAPVRNSFPFPHKPNTLDRDRIIVPAGWDSWGKIAVLREGFEAKSWGEAWEHDLEENVDETGESSAKKMYSNLVEDRGIKVRNDSSVQLLYAHFLSHSPHLYRPSTTRRRSRSFSQRTTTRILKSQIETLAVLSRIRQKVLQLVWSALWAAAASTCRTSNEL